MPKQTLITISAGKYVWWTELQLIDFIPKGKTRGLHDENFPIHLRTQDNTELRAMIRATTNMLRLLKETLKERK